MATMSLINDTLMLLFICTLCYLVWEALCSEFWNYVHGPFLFLSCFSFLRFELIITIYKASTQPRNHSYKTFSFFIFWHPSLHFLPSIRQQKSMNFHTSPTPLNCRRLLWTTPNSTHHVKEQHCFYLLWNSIWSHEMTGLLFRGL